MEPAGLVFHGSLPAMVCRSWQRANFFFSCAGHTTIMVSIYLIMGMNRVDGTQYLCTRIQVINNIGQKV